MRPLRTVVTAVLLATIAAAEDRAPRVDAIVPVPPTEHQRLHYFGRRDHHLVPGTVTIDRAPYVCDADGKQFTDRDAFVAHIRGAHRVPRARIHDRLVVHGDAVHFVTD
jgi:hypothetical protein